MAREVVRALETGPLAEIGLIAFFVAFILILVYVFLLAQEEARRREEPSARRLILAPSSFHTGDGQRHERQAAG
jgi:hypothetical protein